MSESLDEIADALVEDSKLKGLWICMIDGHRIVVGSGKSSWVSIGAAKNALRNHFEKYYGSLYKQEDAYQDLLMRRVEFIQLSYSEE